MSNSIYTPITAPFADTEFVSIRVDNIDYYIVSQLPMDENGINGFPVRQNEAQRDFKRILGKDSKSAKFAIKGVKAKVVCISHEALDTVVAHFAFNKGCLFAQTLMRASFNIGLRRANDYHRGVLEEEAYYQESTTANAISIKSRNKYTAYIQTWAHLGTKDIYAHLTIEAYRHTKLLDRYWAWSVEHKTKSARKNNRFRDTLNLQELGEVSIFEDMVATIGNNHNLNPWDAIKLIKGELK
jgi:hypothetical protein